MAYTNFSSFDLKYERLVELDGGNVVIKFHDRDTQVNMHFKSLEAALTVLRAAVNDISLHMEAQEVNA